MSTPTRIPVIDVFVIATIITIAITFVSAFFAKSPPRQEIDFLPHKAHHGALIFFSKREFLIFL
jgi:hypothetical protein